jgi:hypothetical protein
MNLRSSNYSFWKYFIELIWTEKEGFCQVDGTTTKPEGHAKSLKDILAS